MLNFFAHSGDTVDESAFEHVMDGHHWAGDGGFAVFWMVTFMIIIGITVYLLLSQANSRAPNQEPLEILKARYAKGEITKRQFTKMKTEIKKS